MLSISNKWELHDFSNAMKNAIESHSNQKYLRTYQNKIMFNGFWRNGDKQNICLWIEKATWHDAKTGEGGGCKEFAKTAFNLNLTEFMQRFGSVLSANSTPITVKRVVDGPDKLIKPVDEIWLALQKSDQNRTDQAAEWLSKERGFDSPRKLIGSGFTNLDVNDIKIFEKQHSKLIKHRITLGPQIVAPLRSVHSDHIQNLFFRCINEGAKEEKSRLLTGAGGWSEPDGSPRAFGFPHLAHDFPNVLLCEGMADYFATECLLDCSHTILPIGVTNASTLVNWANWLITSKYQGKVFILYQLDSDRSGEVSCKGTGQTKAIEALKILLANNLRASLFNWPLFFKQTKAHEHKPNDIADVCKTYGSKTISENFIKILQGSN